MSYSIFFKYIIILLLLIFICMLLLSSSSLFFWSLFIYIFCLNNKFRLTSSVKMPIGIQNSDIINRVPRETQLYQSYIKEQVIEHPKTFFSSKTFCSRPASSHFLKNCQRLGLCPIWTLLRWDPH